MSDVTGQTKHYAEEVPLSVLCGEQNISHMQGLVVQTFHKTHVSWIHRSKLDSQIQIRIDCSSERFYDSQLTEYRELSCRVAWNRIHNTTFPHRDTIKEINLMDCRFSLLIWAVLAITWNWAIFCIPTLPCHNTSDWLKHIKKERNSINLLLTKAQLLIVTHSRWLPHEAGWENANSVQSCHQGKGWLLWRFSNIKYI